MKTVANPGRNSFIRASYRARTIGFALGGLSLTASLQALDVTLAGWIALAVHSLVWPHVAWQLASRSSAKLNAECRNLLLDHYTGGLWIAAIGFNSVPSLVMLSMMAMNSMVGGGVRQMLRGVAMHGAGIASGVLLFGWRWMPQSSTAQVLACLPLLCLHPPLIGYMTNRALAALRQQRKAFETLSSRDTLSGLFNRRRWDERLKEEWELYRRTGRIATLVLVDLDHFKQVNDRCGHAAGDEAIRRFAALLQERLRDSDMACRYGGEEFGVLMPETTPAAAAAAMARLQQRMRECPLVDGMDVTASCGIAGLSGDLDDVQAWMRLTDQMLYRAKHNGRDCIVVAGQENPPPVRASVELTEAAARLKLLDGLRFGQSPVALFDPADRLAWRNEAFASLYAAPNPISSFAEIMRNCHALGVGPRIDTTNIEAWLRGADAKRRSRAHRVFDIDVVDGRVFRVEETSFEDGWLLDILTLESIRSNTALALPVEA